MTDTYGNGERWALILGSSSGFGAATALELAREGFNIFGVHLDRKATMPRVEGIVADLEQAGAEVHYYNFNAADEDKRQQALDNMAETLAGRSDPARIHCLLHSLAFGTLKRFVADEPDEPREEISQSQMDMTLTVMAHTLVYWVQDAVRRDLLADNSRVFAMTSSGGTRVIPHYGAVSAAKAALESHVRQLALELAPRKITVNAIRAGVTDTPALRKIPGHEKLLADGRRRNPCDRLTRPEDVGQAIAVLCDPRTHWMSGNVIGVDGGEDIVG